MDNVTQQTPFAPFSAPIAELDWPALTEQLHHRGFSVIPGLLSRQECHAISALYRDTDRFRKRIIMEHHSYGRGEYQYFSYPLPDPVQELRTTLYSPLADIANEWNLRMKVEQCFPKEHAAFVDRCHEAGQLRPTPLLLKYEVGGYNCLHQDLYGEHVFPLQAAVLLSEPAEDFTGGEFLLAEQRPRAQSRGHVVPLKQGDMVIFAVHQRPTVGKRGFHRVNMRHGVSEISSGERYTLGVIFHDAK